MGYTKDGELVLQACAGDREAYGELVTRYQGHVYGLGYSIVNNWVDAQDIAQETFIRAYVNLGQLRRPDRFAAWLRRVTFGVAMNWLKAYRPKLFEQLGSPDDPDHFEIPDFAPGPPEVLEKRDLADAVLEAVASLPPKYRVPLTMFHLDGLSYQKVAEFLDIPLNTVKSLIRRAREKLKPALSAYAALEVTPMVEEVFAEHKLSPQFARKVLEGVPSLVWGRGKDCTFTGALEAALEVTEHPYSYSDIMGFSGLSFRVKWHEGWCPSCTVGEMDEEIEAVARATGWQLDVKLGEGGPDMERFTDDIVADVNAGRPVLVYPPDLNVAVAYGYDDAGKTLLLRDYMKADNEVSLPTRELGFLLIFLGEHTDPLPVRESLLEALGFAVHNWGRGVAHAGPADYWYGEAAFEHWRSDLQRADGLDEEDRRKLFFLSFLNFNTIADARATAVSFLEEHAGVLNDAAGEALERAATLYEEEGEMFGGVFGKKDAFLGPWSGKTFEDWTSDVRENERRALADTLKIERRAIAALENALRAAE